MNFFNLHVEHLERFTNRLRQFHKIFASDFHTKTRSIEKQSMGVRLRSLIDLLIMFLHKSDSPHIPN
jgi:hypothetical protein